jgi:hypothetical protein
LCTDSKAYEKECFRPFQSGPVSWESCLEAGRPNNFDDITGRAVKTSTNPSSSTTPSSSSMTSILTSGDVTTKMLHKARKSAKRLRAAASCDCCRKRRSKCSGFSPCTRCQESGRECVFSPSLYTPPSMVQTPSAFRSVDAAGSGTGNHESWIAAVGYESTDFFRMTNIRCDALKTLAPGMEWTRRSMSSTNLHQPAASWAPCYSPSSIFYDETQYGQDLDSSASFCSDPVLTIVGSTVHSEPARQEQVSKASSFQDLSCHWAAPAAPSRAAAAMPPCDWHGTKADATFAGGSTGGWTLPPLAWIQHAAVSVGGDAGEYDHGGFGW